MQGLSKGNRIIRIMLLCMIMVISLFTWNDFNSYAASDPVATASINSESGAYLRKKADVKSTGLKVLKNNTKVTINKEVFIKKSSTKAKDRWYYVSVSGKKGYVRADLVDNISYKSVSGKTTDSLNYRVGASEKMTKKGTLKKGASITVVLPANLKGNSTKWYKIKKDSKYYYVSSKWVKLSESTNSKSTVKTTESSKSTAKATPVFTIANVSYPSSISQGSSFTMKGMIGCTQKIEKVIIGVVNSSGKWEISATKNVNSTVFDIGSVDASVKFGLLQAGTHTYRADVYVGGKAYTKIKTTFTVKKVSGPTLLANTAVTLAWPAGTSSSKYAYNGGAPTAAYKKALEVAYPEHKNWGAAPSVGASCDVFIGTVCRYCGYDKDVPRTLAKQWTHFANSKKWTKVNYSYKESELRSGDIFIYTPTSGSKHVCMYVKINGKGYCIEASYKKKYGFVNKSISKFLKSSNKKKLEVYRATS